MSDSVDIHPGRRSNDQGGFLDRECGDNLTPPIRFGGKVKKIASYAKNEGHRKTKTESRLFVELDGACQKLKRAEMNVAKPRNKGIKSELKSKKEGVKEEVRENNFPEGRISEGRQRYSPDRREVRYGMFGSSSGGQRREGAHLVVRMGPWW